MKAKCLFQCIICGSISRYRNKIMQIGLLFLFISFNGYSQTVPAPTGLYISAYERHLEIHWDKLSDSYTVEVYEDDGAFFKIGETPGEAGIYILYFGDDTPEVENYRLKARDENTGELSEFSNAAWVPATQMSDDDFLDMVQKSTFRYFWDFAHPTSGLIYESSTSQSSHTISIAGTGFGVMAIIVGIERGYITKQQGITRILKMVNFLKDDAKRIRGAFPHWLNGETGDAIAYHGNLTDEADLLETAFLIQGLLTAKQYFDGTGTEETEIRTKIQTLWEEVEWDHFKQAKNDYLNWHWSPTAGWAEKDLAIMGYNEGLIAYILAIASPTHSVSSDLYDLGWARGGYFKNGEEYGNFTLPLGNIKGDKNDWGGPLFVSQYSFLGLDPMRVGDKYVDSYYEQGRIQTLINRQYCIDNEKNYTGYDENTWGLTSSQSPPPAPYKPHFPGKLRYHLDKDGKEIPIVNDDGTIAPTAAISSIVYTPEESIAALKNFYRTYGDDLWGHMGFYDAFNPTQNWTSSDYLSINQGPMLLMIENYRSNLLWENFMDNEDIINGLNSIESVSLSPHIESVKGTVKIFINNEEKLSIPLGDNETNTAVSETPIEAMIGDELMIEVYDLDQIPVIEGIPDLWIARAFVNEAIYMSSKSITPGAYRPWIPYTGHAHNTLALPYSRKWHTGESEPNRYPEWKRVGNNKYRLRWTLKRTMDANLQYNGETIDYNDAYADEEVPWWQTWDENGNPIVDGTGKFNKDGSVPHGEHAKPDGKYPQRQGKNVGIDMVVLNALKGTLKTAYGENTNFSDGSHYFVKSDGDDTYTTQFKDLTTEPFDVVTPDAELYRPFVELWKVVPDGEMNNPVNEIVTWYQKAIHEYVSKPLPSDYVYDGYEIWEDPEENPVSKAPGKIFLKLDDNRSLTFKMNVQSPIEDDKFYMLYKANDNDTTRDFVVSTNELTIGMDKKIKTSLVDQMRSNGSKFDLIAGYATWDPEYTIKPLTLNDDGTFSGSKTFELNKINTNPALHVFISYRRTPGSEPVVISGTDFWNSFNIEAMRCEEYNTKSESRTLRKSDFVITSLGDKTGVGEHLSKGYPLSMINEEYTIMKDEKLTFKIWDNVDFGFAQHDTKWYMSSRKRSHQLSEADGAKRIRITLTKVADNGGELEKTVLQELNTGTSLTHEHTFNAVGNYIYEASLDRDRSGYSVFVRVLEPDNYGTGNEARVKFRDLSPDEVEYINAVLPDEEKIDGADYKLAMLTDLQASYAWKMPADGGGPRSYMNEDRTVRYIDRFAPFNDYADHYVYRLNEDTGDKLDYQNVPAALKYGALRGPEFQLLPGVWVNHLDPLGESDSKYGVQDEFNLGDRIQNVTSQFIEDTFTQVQQTNARDYMVEWDGDMVNGRSPRDWEIRLPWSSLSKYHGFRLRTASKSPVNAEKLSEAIMKIGKKGGGYFRTPSSYFIGIGTGGVGSNILDSDTELLVPPLTPKFGMMDDLEERLEYTFYLNLIHNRWVVVPNSTTDVIFYNGTDQDNRIASITPSSDASEITGLTPVEIEPDEYHLINTSNLCFSNMDNTYQWKTFVDSKGIEDRYYCTKFVVSDMQGTDPENLYGRILKIKSSKNEFMSVNADNILQIVHTESEMIPLHLTGQEGDDSFLAFANSGMSNITETSFILDELPPDPVDSGSSVASSTSRTKIILEAVGGTVAAGVAVGVAAYVGYKLFQRFGGRAGYSRLEDQQMCLDKLD